jgi:hypothetical protein
VDAVQVRRGTTLVSVFGCVMDVLPPTYDAGRLFARRAL